MLRLDTHYLWDSWIADDGENYHLYVLQAPRSTGGPEHRHVNATVGHAVSADLVDWDYRGTCLGPAEAGFDDLAIWTGSVTREGDHWRMFYTAINAGGLYVLTSASGRSSPATCTTGSGSTTARGCRRTRAGTRRWDRSRPRSRPTASSPGGARPGVIPW